MSVQKAAIVTCDLPDCKEKLEGLHVEYGSPELPEPWCEVTAHVYTHVRISAAVGGSTGQLQGKRLTGDDVDAEGVYCSPVHAAEHLTQKAEEFMERLEKRKKDVAEAEERRERSEAKQREREAEKVRKRTGR